MLGSDEEISMVYTDGETIGTILGHVDLITIGVGIGTKLVSLYGSFDGSKYFKFELLMHGDSLGSNNGKVHGYDEDI